jgi:CubicO group peptidase (beta-lactamase class C family)
MQAALRAALQPLVEAQAQRIDAGVVLAFKSDALSLELAAGYVKRTYGHAARSNITTTDQLMWGSITKMYTASSILHLVDSGALALTDPAYVHADRALARMNRTSMRSLFGPSVANVTVAHLLGMQSGIYDFDDDYTRRFCNLHPDVDVSPLDDVWFASSRGKKQPLYPAGTKQDYSSTNYELLGIILAGFANASAWDTFDQRGAVFKTEALQRRFARTHFALHGPCLNFTRVHGYEPDDEYGLNLDTAYMSCTNGWTCAQRESSPQSPDPARPASG